MTKKNKLLTEPIIILRNLPANDEQSECEYETISKKQRILKMIKYINYKIIKTYLLRLHT